MRFIISRLGVIFSLLGGLLPSTTALATFHLMQIEQVIGGVNGDTSAQAIQLRMRSGSQNLVAQARMRAWDAAGANPILIVDMTTNVSSGASGARVLIASANFAGTTTPAVAPDFTMANLIPASYLTAGSLTFESDTGIIYWRLSWGGASYTGSNAGDITNDPNGNFGPPFASALPSTTLQALRFTGAATAASTSNSAQYAVTAGAATFNNNAGAAFVVTPPPATGACCMANGTCFDTLSDANCLALGGSYQGDDSECGGVVCEPTGACCADHGKGAECHDALSQAACESKGGVYQGHGTECMEIVCEDVCPADISNDGAVGIADLLNVIGAWGPCSNPPPFCEQDVNEDGVVGIADLLAVIGAWGSC